MNEEQWEAFMREGDLRAARFGELLETLIDHPNRDELVAREMGWDEIADALAEDKQGEGWKDGPESSDDNEADQAEQSDEPDDAQDAAGESAEPGDLPPRRRRRRRRLRRSSGEAPGEATGASSGDASGGSSGGSSGTNFFDDEPLPSPEELAAMPEEEWPVEAIPAYQLAHDVAMRVWDALKPWSEMRADEEDEAGEKVGEAFIGIQISAAKLAGGHGMGYDDESICGNIVCCKKGLAGAEQTEQALTWLREEGTLPKEKVDLLLPEVKKVQEAIRARIEELRKRVWW
jgi:hypothetical protein